MKTYICPHCGKPEVKVVWLGWRECKVCKWEEKRPMDLQEATK